MKIRIVKNKNGIEKNMELLKNVLSFEYCGGGWIEIGGTTSEIYNLKNGFCFGGFDKIRFYV